MTSSLHSLVTICQNCLWLGNLHSCSILSCRITPIHKAGKKKKSPPIIKLPNKCMRTVWGGTLQKRNPSNKRRSQQECCECQAEAMCSPAWAGRAPASPAMPMGTGRCSRGMTPDSDRQQSKTGARVCRNKRGAPRYSLMMKTMKQ